MNQDSALNKRDDNQGYESGAQFMEISRADNVSPWVSKGNVLYSEKISLTDSHNNNNNNHINEKRNISDGAPSSKYQNSSNERKMHEEHMMPVKVVNKTSMRSLNSGYFSLMKGSIVNLFKKPDVMPKVTRELLSFMLYINEKSNWMNYFKRTASNVGRSSYKKKIYMDISNMNKKYVGLVEFGGAIVGAVFHQIGNFLISEATLGNNGEGVAESILLWLEFTVMALVVLELFMDFTYFIQGLKNSKYLFLLKVLGIIPVFGAIFFQVDSDVYKYINFLKIFRTEKLFLLIIKELQQNYLNNPRNKIRDPATFNSQESPFEKNYLKKFNAGRSNHDFTSIYLSKQFKLTLIFCHFWRCLFFFSGILYLYSSIKYSNPTFFHYKNILFIVVNILLLKNPGSINYDFIFLLSIVIGICTFYLGNIFYCLGKCRSTFPKNSINKTKKYFSNHVIVIGDFHEEEIYEISSSFLGDHEKNKNIALKNIILFLTPHEKHIDINSLKSKNNLTELVTVRNLDYDNPYWPIDYNLHKAIAVFYFPRRAISPINFKIIETLYKEERTKSKREGLLKKKKNHVEEQFLTNLDIAINELNPHIEAHSIIYKCNPDKECVFRPSRFKVFNNSEFRERVIAEEIVNKGYLGFLCHLTIPKEKLTNESPRNTWFFNKSFGLDIQKSKVPDCLLEEKFSDVAKMIYFCSGNYQKSKRNSVNPILIIGLQRKEVKQKITNTHLKISSHFSRNSLRPRHSHTVINDEHGGLLNAKDLIEFEAIGSDSANHERHTNIVKKTYYLPKDLFLGRGDVLLCLSRNFDATSFVESFNGMDIENYGKIKKDMRENIERSNTSQLKGAVRETLINFKSSLSNFSIDKSSRDDSEIPSIAYNTLNSNAYNNQIFNFRLNERLSIKFKNHIIIYGRSLQSVHNIVKYIREDYNSLRPLLYFIEEDLEDDFLEKVLKFQDVYIVIGDPLEENHLAKLGIENCKRFVLSTYDRKTDKRALIVSRLILDRYPNTDILYDIKDYSMINFFLTRPIEKQIRPIKKFWPLMMTGKVASNYLWDKVFVKQALNPFYKEFLRESLGLWKSENKKVSVESSEVIENHNERSIDTTSDFNRLYSIKITESLASSFYNVGNLVFFLTEMNEKDFLFPLWIIKEGDYVLDNLNEPSVKSQKSPELKTETAPLQKLEMNILERIEMAKWNQSYISSGFALDKILTIGDHIVFIGDLGL
jgi:hypothetical protein